MCLMWVIPMRDLLPLLKRHPQLYHKACSQVVPKVLMDYLTINPLEVCNFPTKSQAHVRGCATTNSVNASLCQTSNTCSDNFVTH